MISCHCSLVGRSLVGLVDLQLSGMILRCEDIHVISLLARCLFGSSQLRNMQTFSDTDGTEFRLYPPSPVRGPFFGNVYNRPQYLPDPRFTSPPAPGLVRQRNQRDRARHRSGRAADRTNNAASRGVSARGGPPRPTPQRAAAHWVGYLLIHQLLAPSGGWGWKWWWWIWHRSIVRATLQWDAALAASE